MRLPSQSRLFEHCTPGCALTFVLVDMNEELLTKAVMLKPRCSRERLNLNMTRETSELRN